MKYTFLPFAEPSCRAVAAVAMFLVFTAGSVQAQLLYYVNDKGAVIYVEDESLIPEKYRKDAQSFMRKGDRVQEPAAAQAAGSEEALQPQAKPAAGQKKGAELKDKSGNPPSFWRQKYVALLNDRMAKEKDLRDNESQRDEIARKLEGIRSKAYFLGDSQSVTEAAATEVKFREIENIIKMTVSQIDQLNRKIQFDIVDEVVQAGGSIDWLLFD